MKQTKGLPPHPYVGLRSFASAEEKVFIGRGEQLDQLLSKMAFNRFIAILGPSGSGKSSLIRAGLIPRLRAGQEIGGRKFWVNAYMRPGDSPVTNMALSLIQAQKGQADQYRVEAIAECIRKGQVQAVLEQLESIFADGTANLLLIIDQFDELFRMPENENAPEVATFIAILLGLAKQGVYPVYVVLSLRDDFLSHLDAYAGLHEAVNDGRFLLGEISRSALREIIRQPPSLYGIEISPRLLGRMVNEIEEEEASIPEIQHLLLRLWLHWHRFGQDRLIDIEHYESIQQIKKALSFHAEHAMIGMKNDTRWLSKIIFQCLVGFDQNSQLFARPIRLSHIAEIAGQRVEKVWELVEKYRENGRLLIDVNGKLETDPILELCSEQIIKRWPRLAEWVEEERNRVATYRRVTRAARAWKQGRAPIWLDEKLDEGLLWLRQDPPTEAWGKLYDPDFNLAITFLKESERARRRGETSSPLVEIKGDQLEMGPQLPPGAAVDAELPEKKVKNRQKTGMLLPESPESGSAEVFSPGREPHIPQIEPGLQPDRVRPSKTDLQQMPQVEPTVSPEKALHSRKDSAAEKKVENRSEPENPKRPAQITENPVTPDEERKKTGKRSGEKAKTTKKPPPLKPRARFTPTAERVIDADAHGPTLSARLASLRAARAGQQNADETKQPLQPVAASQPQNNLSVGPTRNQPETLLPSQANVAPRPQLRQPTRTPPQEGPSFKKSKISPMRLVWVVAISSLFFFVIFNAFSRWQTERLAREAEEIKNSNLEAASWWLRAGQAREKNQLTRAAHLYARAGMVAHPSTGYTRSSLMNIYSGWGPVFLISILPHQGTPKTLLPVNDQLILAADGNKLSFWNTWTGVEGPTLEHRAPISGMILSPKGNYVLSWSEDNMARLFQVSDGRELMSMAHKDSVLGASFNSDESLILTYSMDGSARLWSLEKVPLAEMVHPDWVRGAVFSPNGERCLSWGEHGEMQLWDLKGNAVGATMHHKTGITRVQFSTDGSRLTSYSEDGMVQSWSVEDGRPLGKPMIHGPNPGGVVFGENLVITYGDDGGARLWRSQDGAAIARSDHGAPISGVVLDPLQQYFLTCGVDGTTRIWNTRDGSSVGRPARHQGPVNGALFNRQEGLFLTWSQDGTLQLWNFNGEPQGESMVHEGPVNGAVFSPDGKYILSYSKDQTARLWRTADGAPLGLPMIHAGPVDHGFFMDNGATCITQSSQHDLRVWSIVDHHELSAPLIHETRLEGAVISPDSSRAVTFSKDGVAGLWKMPQGEWLSWLDAGFPVHKVFFSPDGKKLLTYSNRAVTQLFDAGTGTSIGSGLQHTGPAEGAAFSVDGNLFLSYGHDGLVLVGDASGNEIARFPHEGPIARACFDLSGKFVFSLVENDAVRYWRIRDGALESVMPHQGLLDMACNPAHNRLFTWGSDMLVRAWKPGSSAAKFELPHDGPVKGMAIDPLSKRVASFSEDHSVRLWDPVTGEPSGAPLLHQDIVQGACFSPDGSQLLSWSDDGIAILWDSTTNQPLFTYQHEGWVKGGSFSPTGNLAITYSMDGSARLMDSQKRGVIGKPLQHAFPVEGASFNQAGNLALTYSMDGTARLWHTVDGSAAFPAMVHQGAVTAAIFSPDQRFAITTGADGFARIWDLDADYDFPKENLPLLMEVLSGTQIDDSGSLSVMNSETWKLKRDQYIAGARATPQPATLSRKNLYQYQQRFWERAQSMGQN